MKKVLTLLLATLLLLTAAAGCAPSPGEASPGGASPGGTSPETASPETASPEGNNQESAFDSTSVIGLFTREEGSGTRGAFEELTGVGEDMSPEAAVKSETNEILTSVEENLYGISYVSLGSLTEGVKAVSVDGVAPSTATIKDGTFKIQRPFIVCVNAEKAENELVKDFISFMLSAEGQEVSASKWIKAVEDAPAYTASGLSGSLTIGGSTSVDPCMVEMVKVYNTFNPDVNIEITGGGSGTGISEATGGILDIGMSSRDLTADELASLTATTIAQDGVAVIVNKENPITNLTMAQVKSIFTGEVTAWNEIG
ncbi:MAG: substrate-binding domain-containing protein [Oscillospiraceae bacterium]|nr:substrate-binding domain-containing protein [Oscillospiraceae bacterium]